MCSALSSCLPPLQVILTDMMEVVPLLQVNISLNQVMHGGGRNIYQSYMALKHSWGDSVDDLNAAVASSSSSSSFSACSYRGLLLVASDVVYDPAGYRPLVTSIAALLLHHQALYLHQETRRKERPEENSSSVQPPLMVLAHRHRNPENMKWVEYNNFYLFFCFDATYFPSFTIFVDFLRCCLLRHQACTLRNKTYNGSEPPKMSSCISSAHWTDSDHHILLRKGLILSNIVGFLSSLLYNEPNAYL